MKTIRKLTSDLFGKVWVKGKRRYVLVTLLFLVWMLMFDKYRLSTRLSLANTIHSLEETKGFYEKEIVKAYADKKDLELNKEKFAREKYFMHKDNEEVLLIQKKERNNERISR